MSSKCCQLPSGGNDKSYRFGFKQEWHSVRKRDASNESTKTKDIVLVSRFPLLGFLLRRVLFLLLVYTSCSIVCFCTPCASMHFQIQFLKTMKWPNSKPDEEPCSSQAEWSASSEDNARLRARSSGSMESSAVVTWRESPSTMQVQQVRQILFKMTTKQNGQTTYAAGPCRAADARATPPAPVWRQHKQIELKTIFRTSWASTRTQTRTQACGEARSGTPHKCNVCSQPLPFEVSCLATALSAVFSLGPSFFSSLVVSPPESKTPSSSASSSS